MLARVAENLYWMARYLERAEDLARLISVNTNLLLDLPRGVAPGWRSLITIIGAEEEYAKLLGSNDDETRILRFLVADKNHSQSIVSSLSSARENARTFREIIPREAWEEINGLYHFARDSADAGVSKRDRQAFLKAVIRGCQTWTGLLAGCMNHDEPFQFVRLGQNIERADMTTRIIDVRSATLVDGPKGDVHLADDGSFQNIQWMSVLKSLSGYQMYRQERQTSVRRDAALQFLLQSQRFPRSVTFCVDALRACLASMPRHKRPLATISALTKTLASAPVGALHPSEMPAFIDSLQLGLIVIHECIVKTYFARDAAVAANA